MITFFEKINMYAVEVKKIRFIFFSVYSSCDNSSNFIVAFKNIGTLLDIAYQIVNWPGLLGVI